MAKTYRVGLGRRLANQAVTVPHTETDARELNTQKRGHSATAPIIQILRRDNVSDRTALQDDSRQAARDMLQPDGKQLTTQMVGIITEVVAAMTYTRGKLRERASSAKGLSARTLYGHGPREGDWAMSDQTG